MKKTRETTRALGLLVATALVASLAGPARAAVWTSILGGNWSDTAATGWNGAYPNAMDAVATINSNITANQVMNLDVNAVIGSMTLGDSSGASIWSLTDTGALGTALTFDVSSGNASLTSVGGANTISVPITLNDSLNLVTTSSMTLSGAITGGAVGITKSGASRLTLSGTSANTYTGLTTVSAGVLTLNKTSGINAIGGDLLITGGTVGYNSTNRSNQIADGATVTLGGGTFNATAAASTAETIANLTVNSGTFNFGTATSGNTFTVTGITTLSGGNFTVQHGDTGSNATNGFSTGALTISGGTNALIDSGIGAASLTVNGTTTINQPDSGAFTALTITQSRIDLGSSAVASLLGPLTFNGAAANTNPVTIAYAASGNRIPQISLGTAARTWTINDGAASADLVVQASLSGTGGGITKAGAGTLRLDGVNFYTGTTTITEGVLLDNLEVAQSITSATTSNSKTLVTGLTPEFTSGLRVGQPVSGSGFAAGTRIASIAANGLSIQTTIASSASATPTLTFAAASAIPGGLGATGGSSNITFNGGVLGLGGSDFLRNLGTGTAAVQFTDNGGFAAFGANRIVNFNNDSHGVTWAAGSFVPDTKVLILGAANADAMVDFQNPVDFAGAVRTVQVDNGSATVDARMSGVLTNGGLTKTGLGTLELTASNSYAGVTTINAGTLLAGHGSAFGTGEITVNGGVLDLRNYNVGNVINITGSAASVLLPASAGTLVSNFAAGSNFRGWERQSGTTHNTTAQLLGGANGASPAAVTTSWSVSSDTARVQSDILHFAGTGTGTFVLQMDYADIAGKDNAWEAENVFLGWLNGSSQWVNAVDGNTGGTPNKIVGAYDPGYSLGTYGVNPLTNQVWAVVDHNSDFAVVVPEPAALSLLALGGLALLRRRRDSV